MKAACCTCIQYVRDDSDSSCIAIYDFAGVEIRDSRSFLSYYCSRRDECVEVMLWKVKSLFLFTLLRRVHQFFQVP